MEIKTEDYQIWYDAVATTINFQGSLRLNGMEEYAPISELLSDVVEQEPSQCILNLQQLKFLNSSGISVLSQFIFNVRKKKNIQMVVIGSQEIPWQGKSLKNLQRLMPALMLKII
jgi:anti-anti-sigma factor